MLFNEYRVDRFSEISVFIFVNYMHFNLFSGKIESCMNVFESEVKNALFRLEKYRKAG